MKKNGLITCKLTYEGYYIAKETGGHMKNPKKTEKGKTISVRNNTHRKIKLLAARDERSINTDLADDLIWLGIEVYEREKNFATT